MENIAAQIIASSKVVSAPAGEAVASVDKSPTTISETNVPIVADAIGLGVFFSENANEIVSPDMLSDIKSKVDAIATYARDNIKTYSEDAVKNLILKLSNEFNWDNLKPTEKLEKLYDYVDLKKRLQERKNIDIVIKSLKEELNA